MAAPGRGQELLGTLGRHRDLVRSFAEWDDAGIECACHRAEVTPEELDELPFQIAAYCCLRPACRTSGALQAVRADARLPVAGVASVRHIEPEGQP
jgi:hypothetical protein